MNGRVGYAMPRCILALCVDVLFSCMFKLEGIHVVDD